MNDQKYNNNYRDFSAVSIINFNILTETSLVFKFLLFNVFIILVFLITILYPINFYKKLVVKFFSFQLTFKNLSLKIYHVLFLIIGFYVFLYFLLKISVKKYIIRNKNETYHQRMMRLNQKWLVESEIWMVFLNIISLISIYRNAILYNKELLIDEDIKRINDEINKKTN